MNPYNLREKALAILTLCSTSFGSDQWHVAYRKLCGGFSQKAVHVKFKELVERGYIERPGRLTEKGKRALGGTA